MFVLESPFRQPGHLLQRSVGFASPPRGGFAFVVDAPSIHACAREGVYLAAQMKPRISENPLRAKFGEQFFHALR